jgi:hypothetical protein
MTKTNRSSHRIVRLVAVGSVALGAAAFGISTSPGRSTDGVSSSPGGGAAMTNVEKNRDAQHQATMNNLRALSGRKAGKGQQEY